MGPVDDVIADAVDDFAREITVAVSTTSQGRLGGRLPQALRHDLSKEGLQLAAALIDCDAAHDDAELLSYLAAARRTFPAIAPDDATPSQIRHSGLVKGAASWLDTTPPLFRELLETDRANGTQLARLYYELAVKIAFVTISVDAHTSPVELRAAERFRSQLLATMGGLGESPAPTVAGDQATAAGGDTVADSATTAALVDARPVRPIEELFAELDGLIGLDEVKQEVKLVAALLQVQRLRLDRGLPVPKSSRHLVFVGNPGTGKTTVARLLAEIYRTLGVVTSGHLVETDRGGLVAGFVGQTAPRVLDAFDRADQGVLLIDEAYSLVRGGERDFGREAIDAIVKLVEDRRDRVVVIMAGYPDEMRDLVEANPGLSSRFPRTIVFADYSTDELVAIFSSIAERGGYTCDDACREAVRRWFESQPREKGFGNGRAARNLFEASMARHAMRVVEIENPSNDDLITLSARDIVAPGEDLP